MTLRQFEYLVTVVDEGSFTRAAQRLFVTQPSLSKQVAALERELGATLIERLPRGVRLTPAGRAFLPLLAADPEWLALPELAGRRWVLPDESAGLSALVLAACRAAGFSPAAVVRCPHVDVLARLAAAGLGPTMLPTGVIADEHLPLVRRPNQPVLREVTVYSRAEWAPGTEAFRQALRHARRPAPPARAPTTEAPPERSRTLRRFS